MNNPPKIALPDCRQELEHVVQQALSTALTYSALYATAYQGLVTRNLVFKHYAQLCETLGLLPDYALLAGVQAELDTFNAQPSLSKFKHFLEKYWVNWPGRAPSSEKPVDAPAEKAATPDPAPETSERPSSAPAAAPEPDEPQETGKASEPVETGRILVTDPAVVAARQEQLKVIIPRTKGYTHAAPFARKGTMIVQLTDMVCGFIRAYDKMYVYRNRNRTHHMVNLTEYCDLLSCNSRLVFWRFLLAYQFPKCFLSCLVMEDRPCRRSVYRRDDDGNALLIGGKRVVAGVESGAVRTHVYAGVSFDWLELSEAAMVRALAFYVPTFETLDMGKKWPVAGQSINRVNALRPVYDRFKEVWLQDTSRRAGLSRSFIEPLTCRDASREIELPEVKRAYLSKRADNLGSGKAKPA